MMNSKSEWRRWTRSEQQKEVSEVTENRAERLVSVSNGYQDLENSQEKPIVIEGNFKALHLITMNDLEQFNCHRSANMSA